MVDGWLIEPRSSSILHIHTGLETGDICAYISFISSGDVPCNYGVVGSNPKGGSARSNGLTLARACEDASPKGGSARSNGLTLARACEDASPKGGSLRQYELALARACEDASPTSEQVAYLITYYISN